MDPAESIKRFLAERPGQFFCKRCIGESIYLATPTQLEQAIRSCRDTKTYRRGKVICHMCGQDRECIAHG